MRKFKIWAIVLPLIFVAANCQSDTSGQAIREEKKDLGESTIPATLTVDSSSIQVDSLVIDSVNSSELAKQKENSTGSDTKSKEILKRVSRDYQTYKTISSKFTLVSKAMNGKESKSKGQIWMKGKKFKLDYGEQEIFCNSKYIWTYVKGDFEVNKDTFKNKNSGIDPSDLFTIYKRDFKSLHEGEISRAGSVCDVIHMVPNRRKNYSWSWIRLEVEKTSGKIQRLIQHNKNGTEVIIELDLKTFVTNQALADTYFEWNAAAHEDVEVIDLTR